MATTLLQRRNLKSANAIRKHLSEITNLVRRDEIDFEKAQILLKLSDALLRAVKITSLEQRIKVLENKYVGRR